MENMPMDSLGSFSLTNEVKENASIKVTTNSSPSRSEGEKSSVNRESIKSKPWSKSDSDLQFLIPDERSVATKVVNHKRKFLEGEEEEVTSENISKKLCLLRIDNPATKEDGKKLKVSVSDEHKNEVGQSTGGEKDAVGAFKFDLNYVPINEEDEEDSLPIEKLQGDKYDEIVEDKNSSTAVADETAVKATGGSGMIAEAKIPEILTGNEVGNAEQHSFQDNNLVFTLDESDSDSEEENDNAANERNLQFDLNELPPNSDEDA